MVEFSDEEGYGRFLDLHEHYNRYINIKGIERCDYLEFLTHFDKLFDISRDKKAASYRDYISHLMLYLYTYAEVHSKTLFDPQTIITNNSAGETFSNLFNSAIPGALHTVSRTVSD